MPNNVVKSFAEKSGKSIAEVEEIWKEARSEADSQKKDHPEKFKSKGQYYSYINSIVQKRLGIAKQFEGDKISFKNFLI